MSGLRPDAAPAITIENGMAETAQNSAFLQALTAEFSMLQGAPRGRRAPAFT